MQKRSYEYDKNIQFELEKYIDANSVIGKPFITQDGTTIIPVSKITVGYLSGGGEYGEVKIFSKNKKPPFAGGGGAVVNVNPNGFLIVNKNDCKFIKASVDTFDKVFEKTTEFIEKAVNENNK